MKVRIAKTFELDDGLWRKGQELSDGVQTPAEALRIKLHLDLLKIGKRYAEEGAALLREDHLQQAMD